MEIRAATEADWPAIWAIFREVVATREVFAYPPDTTEEVARKLWFDPPAQAYVAIVDGLVVGSSYLRPVQPGLGSHIANAGYMVARSAGQRGVGRALGEHSLVEAKRLGYRAMQFNYVVSTNEHAVRLWQSLGFAIIGTVPAAFNHHALGLVPVHIMHRELH